MRFRSHQCWFPRDAEYPSDYEDASACSQKHGRAVIADGVSSAIFSRTWARLLTRSAVAELLDFSDEDAIQGWLGPLQQEWRNGINFAALPWHQKPRATSVGAQTTLLTVTIDPVTVEGELTSDYHLRASGIGDCVLFLVRDGRKQFSFPLTRSHEFAEPPHILSSIAKGVTYADKFRHLEERCQVDDLLVLCSDAIGLWAMEEYEAGRDVDWMRYWDNDEAWQADILSLRSKRPDDKSNCMRVDDCTLLLLRVVAESSFEDEPDLLPDQSDTPFVLLPFDLVSPEILTTGDILACGGAAFQSEEQAVADSPEACDGQDTQEIAAEEPPPHSAPSENVVGDVSPTGSEADQLRSPPSGEDDPEPETTDSDSQPTADPTSDDR